MKVLAVGLDGNDRVVSPCLSACLPSLPAPPACLSVCLLPQPVCLPAQPYCLPDQPAWPTCVPACPAFLSTCPYYLPAPSVCSSSLSAMLSNFLIACLPPSLLIQPASLSVSHIPSLIVSYAPSCTASQLHFFLASQNSSLLDSQPHNIRSCDAVRLGGWEAVRLPRPASHPPSSPDL